VKSVVEKSAFIHAAWVSPRPYPPNPPHPPYPPHPRQDLILPILPILAKTLSSPSPNLPSANLYFVSKH